MIRRLLPCHLVMEQALWAKEPVQAEAAEEEPDEGKADLLPAEGEAR